VVSQNVLTVTKLKPLKKTVAMAIVTFFPNRKSTAIKNYKNKSWHYKTLQAVESANKPTIIIIIIINF